MKERTKSIGDINVLSIYVLILFFYNVACYGQQSDSVSVRILPQDVYSVQNECLQQVNFDLSICNSRSQAIELKAMKLCVYDANDQIVQIKSLQSGPLMPGIETIPVREIPSHETVTVFNPFTIFNSYADLHRLYYVLSFSDESGEDFEVEVNVKPTVYVSKSELSVPVKGTLFVVDGNDLYANHRRLDLNNPLVYDILDIHTNSELFALDFSMIDSLGNEYAGDWHENANHYIFGKTVYAPADGVVVKAISHFEDNKPGTLNFNALETKNNKDILPGNCIIIDHLNGEYTFLVHLKQGSVTVKEGEQIQRGQPVGQVGNSGSSMYPHLHYQMGDSPAYVGSNALPVYFYDYALLLGRKKLHIQKGFLSTGDIIEHK